MGCPPPPLSPATVPGAGRRRAARRRLAHDEPWRRHPGRAAAAGPEQEGPPVTNLTRLVGALPVVTGAGGWARPAAPR